MANRRMFSRDVVCTDVFLDMPISAQALYFHLGMEGDDDGFVKNPKTIMRMIGAKPDDLNILAARGFIIPFQSGVIAIRHWRIMNTLRNDRYKSTVCMAEKEKLILVDSVYSENDDGCQSGNQLATNWQPSGNQLATQHNITQRNPTEPNVTQQNEDEDNDIIIGEHINGYVSSYVNLSPTAMEELTSFREDDHVPDDVIRYAVDFAIDNNKRSWAYIRAILKAFVEKGLKTLADVKEAEEKRNAEKSKGKTTEHGYQTHTYTEADFGDDFYFNLRGES